jgi:putative transposase
VKEKDNRLVCPETKREALKATRLATALKRKSQVCKVFECKIVEKRLNKTQKEELEKLFVEGKWFYNHVLNIHQKGKALKDINSTNIKWVEHFNKDRQRVSSKIEVLGSQIKQSIVSRMVSNEKTVMSLVRKGLQKHGNLKFKSELNCIPLKQYGITYSFRSFNKVKIQGISGKVLVRTGNQLQVADELANANLIRKPDGYYLKVVAYINKENFKEKPKNGKEIGLDFGIKTNITTSEGEKLDVCVEESERLKKLQKKLFRRVKGSNNRYKTVRLIQREYQKLSNRKRDKANKIVSKLRKYETIVMQDEQIANWHSGLFGRQVQHSCMGLVKAKLKALPQTIVLDTWIPTTKWCPRCGTINRFITLEDRTYHCGCGYEFDRDVHSAGNMLIIKDLVFRKHNLVPTEHREITLAEFKTSADDTCGVVGKSGQ